VEGDGLVKFENVPHVIVKGFLPYIILAIIEEEGGATAYTILNQIRDRLNVIISAGTLYQSIYGLERQGYVERVEGQVKFGATDKGLALLQNAKKTMKELSPKIEALLEGA
jgi:DNA-binding PadR family transcriptional regulator